MAGVQGEGVRFRGGVEVDCVEWYVAVVDGVDVVCEVVFEGLVRCA